MDRGSGRIPLIPLSPIGRDSWLILGAHTYFSEVSVGVKSTQRGSTVFDEVVWQMRSNAWAPHAPPTKPGLDWVVTSDFCVCSGGLS